MSVRYLYQSIPHSKRLCSYYRCQKPILRNIARDKSNRIYHYGCLQTAKDEQWRCPECYATFDATEASFYEAENLRNDRCTEVLRPMCPHCGCQAVRPVARHHEIVTGRLVSCP